jgi:hypothetical protein
LCARCYGISVVFPSIKRYRLCNKRPALQIDSVTPVVQDGSNTAGRFNGQMFLFSRMGPFPVLYYSTMHHRSVLAKKECPMSTLP